jgi:hypothetical protein
MKILCFTTTYNRPYYIYNTINSILNQEYKDIKYCVNINIDKEEDKEKYKILLSDFLTDARLHVIYNKNTDQHINYLKAIQGYGHTNFDWFFKIDDDDIYHKKYITQSLEAIIKNDCDILSYIANRHINNNVIKGEIKEIGKWQPDHDSDIKFGMPSTFIFNKKACDIITQIDIRTSKKIHYFEDGSWKTLWRKNNLKSLVVSDCSFFTYNIHSNNTSSKFLLDSSSDKFCIKNKFFELVYFKNKFWESYIYLNKRNNRLYNINNDDHGTFKMMSDSIEINWDAWSTEKYVIKYQNHDKNQYYYVVNK